MNLITDTEEEYVIFLFNHTKDDLNQEQVKALKSKFKDKQIRFIPIYPKCQKEYNALCKQKKPVAVLFFEPQLPPTDAIENGFQHLAFIDGELRPAKNISITYGYF